MKHSARSLLCVGAAAVVLSGVATAAQTILPSGSAGADVCADYGNRVTFTTCASLSDVVAEILTPGRPDDREPGNLAPNVNTCLGWEGAILYASTC